MTTASLLSPDQLYEKLSRIAVDNPLCRYSYERCQNLTPIINEILELKAEQGALILAHTYVHPDIVYGVADHVGDSYGLLKQQGKPMPTHRFPLRSVHGGDGQNLKSRQNGDRSEPQWGVYLGG